MPLFGSYISKSHDAAKNNYKECGYFLLIFKITLCKEWMLNLSHPPDVYPADLWQTNKESAALWQPSTSVHWIYWIDSEYKCNPNACIQSLFHRNLNQQLLPRLFILHLFLHSAASLDREAIIFHIVLDTIPPVFLQTSTPPSSIIFQRRTVFDPVFINFMLNISKPS